MRTVFISYRRQTAPGEARALFNDLVARLGQGAVFMDVDSISLGRDFRSELQKTLSACDSMLVLIDRDWAAVKDEKGQIRLQNAGDFVRMEIEAGLKRDIAVTPILIKGAQMPAAEELPAEIRDLAYRNGFELSHSRWESDVGEMIRRLGLDVTKQGGQVEMNRLPIAPKEAAGGSVPVGAKPWQKSRPLAFVQGAAARQPPDAVETADRGLEPQAARQPSRKPLVIAGVLGVICLGGGAAAWLASPSVGTTTVTLNRPQATPAETLPARQSVANAQTNLDLAINYRDGVGVSKDDREAARLFRLAADQGNARAQSNLGGFYRDGRGGLPKDDREAARLYKLAADQGYAVAQASLGFFYENGRGGLPKDDREAARLYKLAADQGYASAQTNLGVLYEYGRGGLPKDDREAARLHKLAADQGNAVAQTNLGVFYENGRGGLPKDDREAARLYKLAADQGYACAQNNLGVFYENGRGGLTKDDREAARLYKLAADQGYAFAQAALKRLAP
jgi:TPR repeat protein